MTSFTNGKKLRHELNESPAELILESIDGIDAVEGLLRSIEMRQGDLGEVAPGSLKVLLGLIRDPLELAVRRLDVAAAVAAAR